MSFCKTIEVINSCETRDQLRVAKKYTELYCKNILGVLLKPRVVEFGDEVSRTSSKDGQYQTAKILWENIKKKEAQFRIK